MIFVGYGESHGVKGYYLFDFSRHRFMFFKSLNFDEDSPISTPINATSSAFVQPSIIPPQTSSPTSDPFQIISASCLNNFVSWHAPLVPPPPMQVPLNPPQHSYTWGANSISIMLLPSSKIWGIGRQGP